MTANINNDNKILMTKEGYDNLVKEYKKLTEVDRPAVVADIQNARAMGDLSENGMYSGAREKQSFIEGRIKEVEHILKNAQIADTAPKGSIGIGSKVTIQSPAQTVEYHLVSSEEVDFKNNKISHESPIGQALLGKKVGDTFEVEAPAGKVQYKIVEIK